MYFILPCTQDNFTMNSMSSVQDRWTDTHLLCSTRFELADLVPLFLYLLFKALQLSFAGSRSLCRGFPLCGRDRYRLLSRFGCCCCSTVLASRYLLLFICFFFCNGRWTSLLLGRLLDLEEWVCRLAPLAK